MGDPFQSLMNNSTDVEEGREREREILPALLNVLQEMRGRQASSNIGRVSGRLRKAPDQHDSSAFLIKSSTLSR